MMPIPCALRAPLLVTLMLAGCGDGRPAHNVVTNEGGPVATDVAQGAPARPVEIRSEADGLDFTYAWPGEAAAIAPLDRWLRDNAEKLRGDAQAAAREDQKAAAEGRFPFRGHSYEERWTVVGNPPALLVMQSEGYVFTGGAHGMPIVTTVLWDRSGGQRLGLDAIFDIAALRRALEGRFCTALDAARAQKRGAPVRPGPDDPVDPFTRCVDLTAQTILPVTKAGKLLDTIRVVIMPYEAGPYAEGIYQLDLPVDAAVLASVKPEWRAAFSAE